MTEEVFNLDREQNIAASIDALGKKWEIFQERGRALYFTRPNPDRSDAVIPKHMQGRWTKTDLLQAEISKHVNNSWDTADKAKAKSERIAQAAKEAKDVKEEKTEKASKRR
jgi:hypothetical protein